MYLSAEQSRVNVRSKKSRLGSYAHNRLMHCCLKHFLPLVTIQRMKNCRAKLTSTGSFMLKGLAAWPPREQLSPEAEFYSAAADPTMILSVLVLSTPKPNAEEVATPPKS